MEIGRLREELPPFAARLAEARETVGEPVDWYPYDILGSAVHLEAMLTGENRELDSLAMGLPVADIGGADGDLGFLLELVAGMEVEIVDNSATNHNGLRGARLLRDAIGSRAAIEDLDLDAGVRLPSERYGLVLLLGILYHLQNPFHALRELSALATNCLLSTKVARLAGPDRTEIAELPVGYLLEADELNDDPTNYWIFSPAGLDRIVRRAGWEIVSRLEVGDTATSRPESTEADGRIFMHLRSASPEA